jgi:hypothetical protein
MAGELGQLLGGMGSVQGLTSFIPGPMRAIQYAENRGWPNQYPDMATLVNLYLTGYINADQFDDAMKAQGISSFWSEKMTRMIGVKPGIPDLISLYRRGHLSGLEMTKWLKLAGVDGDAVALLFKAYEYFPPPPDLIRFAVREVYTPSIREKYGMDEDRPPLFISEAYKAGLPQEQAKNYWAAHWELPSAGQMFEMYQREIISKDDLFEGLKSLDIMPFWREKLTQIAYNVITRVDARRMYGLQLLSEEELMTSFRHQGYSPDDAEKMTQFSVRYENTEADGLTRASLIDSYKRDILTEEELVTYLKKLNYVDNVVEYWVKNANYEKIMEMLDILIADVKEQYFMGLITIDELQNILVQADVPSTMTESVLKKVLTEQTKKRKTPTKSDMDDWLQQNIIEDSFYYEHMKLIGYNAEDIQRYMTSIILRRETTGRKFLTVADYVRWWQTGIIKKEEFISTLTAMDYSDEDISHKITEVENAIK